MQSSAGSLDLIFELEGSKALMVEHFGDLSPVESEVAVGEVNERVDGAEKHQVGVVSLTLGLERIVTQLIAVRLIVHVVLFLEGVAMRVGGEDVSMAKSKELKLGWASYLNSVRLLWCL
jgi:hypothetical protein